MTNSPADTDKAVLTIAVAVWLACNWRKKTLHNLFVGDLEVLGHKVPPQAMQSRREDRPEFFTKKQKHQTELGIYRISMPVLPANIIFKPVTCGRSP